MTRFSSVDPGYMGKYWKVTDHWAMPELYTWNFATGETLRYTDWQVPLNNVPRPDMTAADNYAVGPGLKRTSAKFRVGTEVDEIEIDIYPRPFPTDQISGFTWQEACHLGFFDGAYFQLYKCLLDIDMSLGPQPIIRGAIQWFYGRVADIDVGRTAIKMKCKSLLDLLTAQMPKRLYQAACGYHFGDSRCSYDRWGGKNGHGDSTGLGMIEFQCDLGSNQNYIMSPVGLAPDPKDAYDNGTIFSISGDNEGFFRSLMQWNSDTGVMYMIKPWFYPVEQGVDWFQVVPGCNKSLNRCNDFQNQDFFGGFPYIPPPETAV